MLPAIGLGLAGACYRTSYTRVLPCQGFQRSALRKYLDGDRQSALELLQKAVEADPRSSEAHAFPAELYLDSWLEKPDVADYKPSKNTMTLLAGWTPRPRRSGGRRPIATKRHLGRPMPER